MYRKPQITRINTDLYEMAGSLNHRSVEAQGLSKVCKDKLFKLVAYQNQFSNESVKICEIRGLLSGGF
jgi:hypothetical protein